MQTDKNLVDVFGGIFGAVGDIILMFIGLAPYIALAAFIGILLIMRYKKSMARDGEKVDLKNELYGLAICVLIGISAFIFDAGRNTVTDGDNSSAVDVSKKFDANNF